MERIYLLVARIIVLLVTKEYGRIAELTGGIRMTAEEIDRAISDYGRTLVNLPENADQLLDVIRVDGTTREQYSVRMPLWTEQEGRSDLTLDLMITANGDQLVVELHDIHVL